MLCAFPEEGGTCPVTACVSWCSTGCAPQCGCSAVAGSVVFSAFGAIVPLDNAFVHYVVVALAPEASDWLPLAFGYQYILLHITSQFMMALFALSGSVKVIIMCPTIWFGLCHSGTLAHLHLVMASFSRPFDSVTSSMCDHSPMPNVSGMEYAMVL